MPTHAGEVVEELNNSKLFIYLLLSWYIKICKQCIIGCYIIRKFSELHYRGLFCYIIGDFDTLPVTCYIISKLLVNLELHYGYVTSSGAVTLSGITRSSCLCTFTLYLSTHSASANTSCQVSYGSDVSK